MAKAEGKKFSFDRESAIKTSLLETFPFSSKDQYICTETHEFSAVCPFSGLPDIGYIKIEYYPAGGRCVELKSLKYYLITFRNVGIYQEAVTKRIHRDLRRVLKADAVRVTTIYKTRGGFDTTCVEGWV